MFVSHNSNREASFLIRLYLKSYKRANWNSSDARYLKINVHLNDF